MTSKSQADHLTQTRAQGLNAEFPRFFIGSWRLRMNGGKARNGVLMGCFSGNVLPLFDRVLPAGQKVEQMVIKGTKYRRYEQFFHSGHL